MKKLLSAVLAILVVLGMTLPAFADMGAPYFKEYDVRVINKDGAVIYDYSGSAEGTVVPYDTVLTVTGDYIEDGITYLSIEYGDSWGYVSGTDVILLEDGLHYSEGVKLKHPRRYVVLGEGVHLRKGPGYGYDEIGDEIPVGTEFDSFYSLEDSNYVEWTYATIDGVGGWIYVFQYFVDSGIATVVNEYSDYGNSLYILDAGARLMDSPDGYEAEYITDEIPIGTKLEFKYYYELPRGISVQVEYNGVTGWIFAESSYSTPTSANNVAIEKTSGFWINSGRYPIYSRMGDNTSEVIGYVESGTMLETLYSCPRDYEYEQNGEWIYYTDSWYAVDVNGQLGWINMTSDWDSTYIWDVTQKTIAVENANIYQNADTSSEVIATAPFGSDILYIMWQDNMYLIDYEGKRGWIPESHAEAIPEDESSYFEASKYTYSMKEYFSGKLTPEYLEAKRLGIEIEEEPQFEEPVSTTSPAKDEDEKDDSFSSTQLIIFCAAGVAVVAITAAVILILINKKKKN